MANFGFLLGLYLVGALIIPINNAASSMVKRSGSFWKKDLEALLTPKRFSLKGTVFKYNVMISCFVKLRSNLMAMITGWETVDDDEVKELVEEAIEETGLKIKVIKEGVDEHENIKNLMVKAMKETEDKVMENKLKGQNNIKHKKVAFFFINS